MEIEEILERVKQACKKNDVSRLILFGSFAKGTSHAKSDIDIAVYGDFDYFSLLEDLEQIETLREFDVVDMRTSVSSTLQNDIIKYGKVLY